MEYTRLGPSGLKVSRIALGCMSFGDTRAAFNAWSLDDDGGRADLPPGRRARHHLLGHRERLRLRQRPRRSSAAPSRQYTRRDDVVLATKVHFRMHDGPGGAGPVPQGDHGADRRLAGAPRHRLRRPLPDPPLRPGDAGRGDDGGAARRRQGRQGPLPRRLVDVGVAVREDAARRRPRRLDALRLHAGPVQPACSARRSARCSGCSPTRAWAPSRGARWPRAGSPGRGASRRSARTATRSGSAFFDDGDQPIVDAVQRVAESPRRADGAGRAGLGAAQPGRQRADRRARPSRTTSPTPSPRSTSSSPTTRSPRSRSPTPRASRAASDGGVLHRTGRHGGAPTGGPARRCRRRPTSGG